MRKTYGKRITTPADKAATLELIFCRGLMPPPRISVPDWADRYRRQPKEAGNLSGKWKTSTVEVSRGPQLAVTEPGVRIITVMCCTQLLKTTLLENIFGFHAHLDPCPMLLVQPKEDAAEQFSRERITPLVKATKVLRALVGTSKTRSGDDTLLFKKFPGGFLALAGAGSPDNLARRPIRIAMYDEGDKYPITKEGHPIALGDERLATFDLNSLSVRVCSPTIADESLIEASYGKSDQRRASIVCPHCGHRQFLDFFRHVQWDKDEYGEHKPKTARIYCEGCGVGWSEGDRLRALASIRWHQTRPFICCDRRVSPLDAYDAACRAVRAEEPEAPADPVAHVWDWWAGERWAVYRARCPVCGGWPVDNEHAGFQAGKLYSPRQKDKPSDIARKFLDAKGNEDLITVWWNTQLGLPRRRQIGKEIKTDALLNRREVYPAEVPDGVAFITIGYDQQDNRGELEFVGWGRDEESWSLDFVVIPGDPDSPDYWKRVREQLIRRFHRADGHPFVAQAACLDSGGHFTQQVYAFARDNAVLLPFGVWAIKGDSERSGQRSPVWPKQTTARKFKSAYKPVILGTNAAKDVIAGRLLLDRPGPGYMHFPANWDSARFDQLTAEKLMPRKVSGRIYRVWAPRPGRTNEALDCRVYAYAALCGALQQGLKLNDLATKLGAKAAPVILADSSEGQRIAQALEAVPMPVPEPPPKPATPPPRVRKVGRSQHLQRIRGQ